MAEAPTPIDIMTAIRQAYPNATAADIKASLTPRFLAEAYGKMPGYSTLEAPALHNVKTATVGSFVICHGTDTSAGATRGEPVIAVIKRGDKGYGVTGGYTDLGSEKTAGEQPKQGAVRELGEEALDDNGKPIVSPDSSRLQLIMSGIDYRNTKLPVNYNGHALELTTQELSALKRHSTRMQNDESYSKVVSEKSGGEVANMQIMPISEVLKLDRESFTHPHEYDAVQLLAEQLKQRGIART